MQSDGSPTILISRLSHIGDCVLTLPLATMIRKKYPAARIVWLCEKPGDQLVRLCPDIDEVLLAPKNWMKKPSNWFRLRRQLRKYKFDFAIDPQGITKSAMLARISGAKTRIGIRGRWGRELSTWLNNRLVETRADHIVERSLELLEPLGIEHPTAVFNLSVDPPSLVRMNRFLSEASINGTFAILNPGASWPSRRWDAERFFMLANYLSSELGVSSVVTWAGETERLLANSIVRDTDSRCVMAPKTTLAELAALCHFESGSRFMVCADTGPLHIASAMGTPCVGLYGTTRPQDSGAYGPQHIALQAWYQGGTTRDRRVAENAAMQDISVEQVGAACRKIIEQIANRCAA